MRLTSAVSEPEGPVALPDGTWLVVEMSPDTGRVTHLEADGTRRRVVARTGRPNGLAVDGRGDIWVAESQQPALIVLSPEGEERARISQAPDAPFRFPNDVAFGPDGALYLTDSGILIDDWRDRSGIRADWAALPYDGRVFRVDPATLEVTTLDAGLRFTNGLAFDADGDLYVNETVTGAVYRYRLSQGLTYRENHANVLDPALTPRHRGPDGMAFDTEGRLYCAVFGQGDVAVIAPDGTIERRIPVGGARPTNVAFAHDGAPRIVVTEVEQGAVEIHDVPAGGLALHAP